MYWSTCCCRSVRPCMDVEPTEHVCPCQTKGDRADPRSGSARERFRLVAREGDVDGDARLDGMAFSIERRAVSVAKRARSRLAPESVAGISDDSHGIGFAIRAHGDHDLNALVVDLLGVRLRREGTVPLGAALDR